MRIREVDIATVVALSRQIPEFDGPPGISAYEKRLAGVPHLLLAAEQGGQLAGFKAGYEREGYFYSWMGGVLPAFRRKGLARALAQAQENWARQQGYTTITFKTRNQHKGMLLFALKNGFDIIGFKAYDDVKASRILLRKNV
jgi:ribosomal protein S18 acetylase RimI-like enzyme